MATTTTNFGWDIPQSTDLVKDGATAIAALGQDIDTAFVDLKGGTTGQVLAKASNTDLDYSWVTTDDTNAIQNAIVDAKGDLITATAADTPARLAVGNNGETLVADSSTSTGLRYQGSIAAGKNFLINGNFDIWQRGTSFSSPLGTAYTCDRWDNNGDAGGTTTISRQTTGVPTGSQYCIRTAYGASTSYANKSQIIETSNTLAFAGQTVTFQVKLRRNASFASGLNVRISKSATVDASAGATWTILATTLVANASLPTGTTSADWYTATVTAAIPNDGTANSVKCSVAVVSAGGSGEYWEMAQAQIELGSVATTFSRAAGNIQGELAACQRYYWRATPAITNFGVAYATNGAQLQVNNPVPMRVKGSSVDYSGLTLLDTVNTATTVSSLSINASSTPEFSLFLAVGNTPIALTQFRSYYLSGTYLGVSAEL